MTANAPAPAADLVTGATDLAGLEAGCIAVVFGTRPEIIKLAGIIELLGPRARTIFSGQHFDELLSRLIFEDLHLPQPDVKLGLGGRSRAQQIGELVASALEAIHGEAPGAGRGTRRYQYGLGGALAANAFFYGDGQASARCVHHIAAAAAHRA